MANESQRILVIEGLSWLSGISAHSSIAVGGLFSKATNFDPNEKLGIWVTNKTPTRYGNAQITEDITSMVVSSSSVASAVYIHAFGDQKKLYRINVDDGTTVDQSTRIAISGNNGSIVYKNKTVYASTTQVAAHDYPPSTQSANEIELLSGLTNITDPVKRAFHIGPDRNLYMTNGQYIAKITSVTGTVGNTAQHFSFEADVLTRDIDDDGIHLIFGADARAPNTVNTGGLSRCFVAFWNMKSQDFSRIWEFTDERIYGIAAVEDEVLIFGRNNIYTCSVGSRPKILLPLRGNSSLGSALTAPNSIIKKDNSIVLWGA